MVKEISSLSAHSIYYLRTFYFAEKLRRKKNLIERAGLKGKEKVRYFVRKELNKFLHFLIFTFPCLYLRQEVKICR